MMVISPAWKQKSSTSDPSKYHGLSVLHPMGKLLALCYLQRLDAATLTHDWLAPEQAGFRAGHRIEDHQLLVTYLMLGAASQRGPLALAFIDLEKAYDRIPRLTLWCVLAAELHIPSDICSGIEVLYNKIKQCERTRGQASASFKVNMGVKQGCPASPRVFTLLFDRVRDFITSHAPPGRHAYAPYLAMLASFILLYADDVALLTDTPDCLQLLLHAFVHFADANGMRISQDKTQVLLCSPHPPTTPLTCQGHALSFTDRYHYLGQEVYISPNLLHDLATT